VNEGLVNFTVMPSPRPFRDANSVCQRTRCFPLLYGQVLVKLTWKRVLSVAVQNSILTLLFADGMLFWLQLHTLSGLAGRQVLQIAISTSQLPRSVWP